VSSLLGFHFAIVVKKTDFRSAASGLVEKMSLEPRIASDLARDVFATTALAPPKPVEGHTHATAAALRTSATNFVREVAAAMGSDVFVLEMSKSDQRKGMKGTRQWRWAKDTNVDNRSDPPADDDVEYVCDVDYYVNMPALLASRAKPTLLYTVVPEVAAGTSTDDTSYNFSADGTLNTIVAGGGTYSHQLWDYAGDSLMAVETWWGVPVRAITYAIERRQVGFSRQVILLSPIRIFRGLAAYLATLLLQHKTLARFNPIVTAKNGDQFVRFRVHKAEGTSYTTARPDTHLCATVPAEVEDAIATVARLGTTNLMLPTTASWLEKSDRASAAVLTEFYRAGAPAKMPTVYPVSLAVRTYQYEPATFDQEARSKIQAFMSPLVHSAFAPANAPSSERRCVEGRVNGLKKPEPKPSPFVMQCMRDFVVCVVGDTVLEPFDVETVIEKQTTPAQKLSLLKAVVSGLRLPNVLKCFVKSESYPDVKDPRNISTYNDKDKLTMAQFALALSGHLKQFEWYGPGKTPLQVANRVAAICKEADMVNVSDYHRMDGTITYLLRQVDRMVFMKAFKHHRGVLNDLLKTNADNIGILPHGTTFEQGPSHGSGCSATSTSQTLRAAFAAYLGFRNANRPDGGRYTSGQAFDALGIHLGDDGLDADLPVVNHEWAAKRVGLVLEAGVVQRGHRGVTFLARYYSPDVWTGRLDSMCDVKRQLSKLHVTVRLPAGVTPGSKLVEKALGLVATDANTPVLGQLATKAVALADARRAPIPGLLSWWAKYEASEQFPNSNADGWMDAEFCTQFPEFDRRLFGDWLSAAGSIEALLAAPLCAEPKPATPAATPAVVDGDVLPAKETSTRGQPTEGKANAPETASSGDSPAPSVNGAKQRSRPRRRPSSGKTSPAPPEVPGPPSARSPEKTDAKQRQPVTKAPLKKRVAKATAKP
jgi:hypothetical protein